MMVMYFILFTPFRLPNGAESIMIYCSTDERAAALQEVERQMVGDAAEPCGERSPMRVVAADVAEGAQEGVLRQFLGIHCIAHLTGNHGEELRRIAAYHQALPFGSVAFHGFHYLFVCIHADVLFELSLLIYTTVSGKYPARHATFSIFLSQSERTPKMMTRALPRHREAPPR